MPKRRRTDYLPYATVMTINTIKVDAPICVPKSIRLAKNPCSFVISYTLEDVCRVGATPVKYMAYK